MATMLNTSEIFNRVYDSTKQALKVTLVGAFAWQDNVKDKDTLAPPASPSDGDRYLIAGTGTGGWTGYDNYIAEYDSGTSAWVYTAPSEGMMVYVDDEDDIYLYTTSWSKYPSASVSLGELSDVTLTSPATNSYLTYNGSAWIDSAYTLTLEANNSVADWAVTQKIIETINAHGTVSSGTEDFDLNDGSYHTVTVGGNFTLTFSNWPASGKVSSIILKLTNAGAFTITWPAAVDWPNGTEPLWTSSGVDFAIFFTDDGGTTIYGDISMQDVK